MIRITLTVCLIGAFSILSWRSYHQEEDHLFGNKGHTDHPDGSPGDDYDKLCPRPNTTTPVWESGRDECSLNCDPSASYQGHPGGSTSSLFFLLPVIWAVWTRKDDSAEWGTRVPFYLILSFHFTGLAVASLVFHARRTRFFWQMDIAFTLLSTWALFNMEVLDWAERDKRKFLAIPCLIVYFGAIIPIAFIWRFWDTFPGHYDSTFQLVVGLFTGLLFFWFFSARLKLWTFLREMWKHLREGKYREWWEKQERNTKFNYSALLIGVVMGMLGALFLDANLQKENENNESAFYFCPNPFASSLAIGHILLSMAITAVCVTFQHPIQEIAAVIKSSVSKPIGLKVGSLHF